MVPNVSAEQKETIWVIVAINIIEMADAHRHFILNVAINTSVAFW